MDNGYEKTRRAGGTEIASVITASLIAAAGILLFLIMPVLGAVALTCAAVYLSARGSFAALLPCAAALVGVYFIGGAWTLAVAAALVLASIAAGRVTASGGNFFAALMTYTLVAAAGIAVTVAVYFRVNSLNVSEVVASFTESFRASVREMFSQMESITPVFPYGGTAAAGNDELLETYLAIAEYTVMYLPALVICLIEAVAIGALRLSSLFFKASGSTLYPREHREARVSLGAAIVYMLSLILTTALSGGAGFSAGNVFLSLTLPCAFCGVCGILRVARRCRAGGRRGLGIFLPILLGVTFATNPLFGVIFSSVAACCAALRVRRKRRGEDE